MAAAAPGSNNAGARIYRSICGSRCCCRLTGQTDRRTDGRMPDCFTDSAGYNLLDVGLFKEECVISKSFFRLICLEWHIYVIFNHLR